ncbi:MAG: matrixin family metalloprotease [Pirellulaceae bacterium]
MAQDFKSLARLVLKDIVDSGLAEKFRPTLDQLEKGLKRLGDDNFLTAEGVSGKKGRPLLTAIRTAVEVAQKQSGGLLTVDQLFGMQTISWLEFGTRCLGRALQEWKTDKKYRDENSIAADVDFRKLEIRYFIDRLPLIASSNPRRLLEQAWQSWMLVCGLVATECDSEDVANVVVTTQQIDGPSNVLADAHVGPPERVRLELRFDKDEIFDEFRFEATACHEIGHLLGLSHTPTPGQLMNSSLGILKAPQAEDGQRAAAIWGVAPSPIPVFGPVVLAPVPRRRADGTSF